MTTYYVENHNVEISAAVNGSQVDITVVDTLYTDVQVTHAASSPLQLQHSDVIKDIEDSNGSCDLSLQSTSYGSWTLTLQRKDGGTWSSGQSTLTIKDTDGEVEWRVQATSGGTTLNSDPFIRVFKGQPSERNLG